MSLSLEEREQLLAEAEEARGRRRRRRLIGGLVRLIAMLAVLAVAIVVTIGFADSWWVEKRPAASPDQRASDGSSVFTQAGIDYFTKEGVLRVTMGRERPGASDLGLPASGTRHVELLVPLAAAVTGTGTAHVDLVDEVTLVTSGGRISALELPFSSRFPALLGQVQQLAPELGWSDADVASFDAALQGSRAQHGFSAYSATIGPVEHDGMRISATLTADATAGPTLVVTFRPLS